MNELTNYTHIAQSTRALSTQNLQNEYITLYGNVIVYRNISSTGIYNLIDRLPQGNERHRLLLVRQNGMDVSLLWTGTIPREYQVYRHYVDITVGKEVYTIVASISISQDKRGW
jgi:hypothetical protein